MYGQRIIQPPNVSEAVEALINYSTGRVSPRTVEFYSERLAVFCARFGDRLISDITTTDIETFISELLHRDCRYADHPFRQRLEGSPSISYVKGFERAIRRLFNFASGRGWLPPDQNPWKRYRPIKKDQLLATLQPRSEIAQFSMC